MIELDSVELGWSDAPTVLSGLSLQIAAGEKVALLGPNGCGKSTLLQMLAGLVFPQRGVYRYCGQAVTRERLRKRERDFRREVGLVFQNPEAMFFNATVSDEISWGPRRLGWSDAEARTAHWARELGLMALLKQPPHRLSGGEKQRLALACVLILEPKLLLLDEPTANLDPRTVGWLCDYLLGLETTVILSTHSLGVAAEVTPRALVLERSTGLLADGPTEQILSNTELLVRAGLVHRRNHTVSQSQKPISRPM